MFNNLRGDIFGGVTAGIVALPLALAFGVQSGLGAEAGIYGAIALGFFASLFGGTPAQVSGPTGPMTVITAVVIATVVAKMGGLAIAMPAILMCFALAGLLQIGLGFLGIGKYIRYIPYPVISGFMSGIGVIIILFQVFPSLGHSSPAKILDVFLMIQAPLAAVNMYAVMLTVLSLVIIYLFPRFNTTIPSPLVALLSLTLIASFAGWEVPKIGDIPSGLPALQLHTMLQFDWSLLTIILLPAATLAALGMIDSLLTSVVVDNMTRTRHNSNQELVGQGIGNMFAAMIGGIPGAGATMRTVVNINAGGRTRLSGMVHASLLLLILLGLGKYAREIPLSVLAGILISVGISIIDYRGLRHIRQVPRTEAVIMLAVLLLTVFINLLQAVAVGLILASIVFMKEMSDMVEEKTKIAPLEEFDAELPVDFKQKVYVKQLAGPLFFGFTSQFQAMVQAIPHVEYVIIRMQQVPYMDQSGLYALEDAVLYLRSKNIHVLFAELYGQPMGLMEQVHMIPDLVPREEIFATFTDSVTWLKNRIQERGRD